MFHSFASAEPIRRFGQPVKRKPVKPKPVKRDAAAMGAAAAQPTPQKQPRATYPSSDSSSDEDVVMYDEEFDPSNREHQQRLWDALQDEDKTNLRKIVKLEGFDVNMVLSINHPCVALKGLTLLCVAMSYDWESKHIVSNMNILLSQPGIEVNKICEDGHMRGVTPLAYAIMRSYRFDHQGGIRVRTLLADRRVDVNLECTEGPSNGKTPLIIAIQLHRIDIWKLLLARSDVNINKVTKTEWSALDAALRTNDYELMDTMMGHEDIRVTKSIFVHAFIDLTQRSNAYFGRLLSHLENNNWNANWLEDIFQVAWHSLQSTGTVRTPEEDRLRIKKLEQKIKNQYDTVMWPSICYADTPRIFDDVWRIHKFDLKRAQQLAEDAVVNNSIHVFSKLLDRGIDVNYIIIGDSGRIHSPLLTLACQRAHLNIVRELLIPKHKCDVNRVTERNETALHFAVDNLAAINMRYKQNGVDVVLALLEHVNLHLNVMTNGNKWDYTPFMAVCSYGNTRVARAFLEKLDVDEANTEDSNEETALSHAYKKLCESEREKYQQYKELFEYLVGHPKIRIGVYARFRMKSGTDSWSPKAHIIEHVIIRRETDFFRMMLPNLRINRTIPGEEGLYPLELACRYQNVDILQEILKYPGVDLTLGNPFQEAMYVDWDRRDYSIGSWRIIKILLEQPFTPEQVNKVNGMSRRGCTPLMVAIEKKMYKAAELLCADPRTDVNAAIQPVTPANSYYNHRPTGYTALMCACRNNDKRMVRLLLRQLKIKVVINKEYKKEDKKDELYVKDVEGNTVLHIVAFHQDTRCLNALIDYFGNHSPEKTRERMNVGNNKGETAFDIAKTRNSEIAAIILYYGGRPGIPTNVQRALREQIERRRALSQKKVDTGGGQKRLPQAVADRIAAMRGLVHAPESMLKF